MSRSMTRFPLSARTMLPVLAGTLGVGLLLSPVWAETAKSAETKTPAIETEVIEPQSNATEVTSLQIEPGTGNIVIQTSGAFLSPNLDTGNWPNQLSLRLPNTDLDAAFESTPDVWLNALKTVYPQATAVQMQAVKKGDKSETQLQVTLQGVTSSVPKPKIIVNTGSLLTIAVKPTEQALASKNALPQTQVLKPRLSLVSLYQYFAAVDPSVDTNGALDGRVRQAWNDFLSGNNGSAILALRPYVEQVPEDTAAHYLLAAAYLASGEPTGAERELETLLLQNQASLPLVLDVLSVKLQDVPDDVRRDRSIPQLLQQAFKKWPEHPALYYYAAQYAVANNQPDDAKQKLIAALERDPQPQYFRLLGDIEWRQGNAQAARVAYWDALALSPNDTEARVKLGMIDGQQQRSQQALKQYTRAFSAVSLLDYAALLQANNQSEEALAALKMADLAVGDARSFALLDQNKPIVYELGMRFADFKENADAQRNLKLFLELSNLKPDSAASEGTKQVLLAKETLKRLEALPNAVAKTTPKPQATQSAKLIQPKLMGSSLANTPPLSKTAPASTSAVEPIVTDRVPSAQRALPEQAQKEIQAPQKQQAVSTPAKTPVEPAMPKAAEVKPQETTPPPAAKLLVQPTVDVKPTLAPDVKTPATVEKVAPKPVPVEAVKPQPEAPKTESPKPHAQETVTAPVAPAEKTVPAIDPVNAETPKTVEQTPAKTIATPTQKTPTTESVKTELPKTVEQEPVKTTATPAQKTVPAQVTSPASMETTVQSKQAPIEAKPQASTTTSPDPVKPVVLDSKPAQPVGHPTPAKPMAVEPPKNPAPQAAPIEAEKPAANTAEKTPVLTPPSAVTQPAPQQTVPVTTEKVAPAVEKAPPAVAQPTPTQTAPAQTTVTPPAADAPQLAPLTNAKQVQTLPYYPKPAEF